MEFIGHRTAISICAAGKLKIMKNYKKISFPESPLSVPDTHRSVFLCVINKSRLRHERWADHSRCADHSASANLPVPRSRTCLGGSIQWHRWYTILHVTLSSRLPSSDHDFLVLSFSYELPTPSRSRDNTDNIFDPNYKTPQYEPSHNPQITPVNNFNNQFGYSLVPIYIPNEGYRYFVVVPVAKWNYLNTNYVSDDRNSLEQQSYDKYDKYNGRFNAKLKKYKAYEKFLKPQPVSEFNVQPMSH